MTTLSSSTLIDSVITLFTEAYEGIPAESPTWFTDHGTGTSILGLLDSIPADQASRSVTQAGGHGSTIASNAEHLRWSLAQANAVMRGERFQGRWEESWRLLEVDTGEWERLRAELRLEFQTARQSLKSQSELRGEYITPILALVAHSAFHLGALLQMAERVKENI